MRSRRLLLITRNLPPLRGGMERLNARMALELSKRFDVEVIGPPGCAAFVDADVVVHEAPSSNVALFLLWASWKAGVVALMRRPAWILGGSGLVAPIVRMAAVLSRGRTAVYLHGLDIVVAHPLYQALWVPSIRRIHQCFCNSRATAALAVSSGIESGKIETIFPGVDTTRLPPSGQFGYRHGIADRKIMLSVGRLTRRKGLDLFIEKAMPSIVSRVPNAMLVIIGDDAPNALAAGPKGMRERIQELVDRMHLSAHVVMLGPVSERELHDAYASSDTHVFPVRDVPGDVEGFGMVAIEAAAQGLPTVAFAVGGVTDAVKEGCSGHLVVADDYVAFAESVVSLLQSERGKMEASCISFAQNFAWPKFGERLANALDAHEGHV